MELDSQRNFSLQLWSGSRKNFIINEALSYKVCIHCGFLEHWNSQKSVSNIWQRFSYLLDEGIPKIWKKLNSHDGFLSYLQNSTANSAHLSAHFCTALVCPLFVQVGSNNIWQNISHCKIVKGLNSRTGQFYIKRWYVAVECGEHVVQFTLRQ